MVNHNDEFITACQRAESVLANKPRAIAAKYDRQIERIVIDLSSGLTISFKPSAVQGLEEAKPETPIRNRHYTFWIRTTFSNSRRRYLLTCNS